MTDIFRTFHQIAEEYTFFSSAHGTFSRIDQLFGHKSNLSKIKKTEIISSIFSDHNTMRLYVNYKEKTAKTIKSWRLNNTLLNSQQVTEEIKREIKKFLETNDNENITQNLWECSKSSPKREIYSNTILPQEIRKTLNRQPNFTPKTTGKRKKKKNPSKSEGKKS